VKAISAHCPTRFATMPFVAKDVARSKVALQMMAMDDGSDACTKNMQNATEVKQMIMGMGCHKTFWTELLITLLQPISDAIHQLEAARPLLSQPSTV
jgi:hypothetical protein